MRGKNIMIELVVPTVELKEKALDYRQEHFDFGETVINGSERLDQIKEYEITHAQHHRSAA